MALLRFAIDNIKMENEKKFAQTTELLSLLFNGPDYYYPDKQQKDISALIKWKEDKQENTKFVDKINSCFTEITLDKNFIRQVYLNLADEAIVAFGDTRANKAHTFVRNEEVWDARVFNNFSQKTIPASLFYSLPVIVKNETSIILSYNEKWKNKNGISFRNVYFPYVTVEGTLGSQAIIFTNDALRNGISIENCQNFKNLLKPYLINVLKIGIKLNFTSC